MLKKSRIKCLKSIAYDIDPRSDDEYRSSDDDEEIEKNLETQRMVKYGEKLGEITKQMIIIEKELERYINVYNLCVLRLRNF
jgi:hypothetical protein